MFTRGSLVFPTCNAQLTAVSMRVYVHVRFGAHVGLRLCVCVCAPVMPNAVVMVMRSPVCHMHVYRHITVHTHLLMVGSVLVAGEPATNDITFQRMPEWSGCSPGKCSLPKGQTAPAWCEVGYVP